MKNGNNEKRGKRNGRREVLRARWASRNFWSVQSKLPTSAPSPSGLVQGGVTVTEYGTFENAYDYFDKTLFEGSLPPVFITLQRHPRALGYFSAKRFQRRGNVREHIGEIALNPDGFAGRTDEEILSTLVHEMAHVAQKEHGDPGRRGYHNREWAQLMFNVGLMPSTTGKPGGAVTGENVSHYILNNGPFDVACRAFLERYRLVWESAAIPHKEPGSTTAGSISGNEQSGGATEDGAVREKRQTRTKFTCPNHRDENLWAKPSARFLCDKCFQETNEPVLMMAGLPSRGKRSRH
jgi:SprT-like family